MRDQLFKCWNQKANFWHDLVCVDGWMRQRQCLTTWSPPVWTEKGWQNRPRHTRCWPGTYRTRESVLTMWLPSARALLLLLRRYILYSSTSLYWAQWWTRVWHSVDMLQVEQLMDRFDVLESRSQQRGIELEETGQWLNSLYAQISQMDGWLNHALTAIRRESVDASPAALKVQFLLNIYNK